MKKYASALTLLLAASMVLSSCTGQEGDAESDGKGADSTEQSDATGSLDYRTGPVNVKVTTVQPGSFDDMINVVGVVKPAEEIMVASEEGGKVESWSVRKGTYVRAGRSLLSLNDDILKAQLKGAKAQYNIAQVNAEKSEKVFADAGAVSEISVTTAQYNLDAAEANVELLETRIAKMSVKAPVSGRIEERLVDVGEMVAPGSPVAKLLQTGIVKISAGIPERYVDGVRIGLPVTMTFDALNGEEINGKITYVGGTINQNDRTLPIEVELPNRGGRFKPEMVAELDVLKERLRNVVVLPRTALVRTESGWQIYVAVPADDGEGYVVEPREVTLGPSDRGNIVIESGIDVGDYVITVGQNKVNPGEAVQFDR